MAVPFIKGNSYLPLYTVVAKNLSADCYSFLDNKEMFPSSNEVYRSIKKIHQVIQVLTLEIMHIRFKRES